MEKTPRLKPQTYAKLLQYGANALSLARIVGGVYMGKQLARKEDYRSMPTMLAIGTLAATDLIDGSLARRAKNVHPEHNSKWGKWLDQIADKVFVHGVLAGMTTQAYRNNNRYFAATLATNQAVQLSRDIAVTVLRSQAESAGADTSAQRLGKIKTTVGLVALTGLAAPAVNGFGQEQAWAGGALLTASSALSAVSGISLTNNLAVQVANSGPLEELLHEAPSQSAIRIVLDDTNQAL